MQFRRFTIPAVFTAALLATTVPASTTALADDATDAMGGVSAQRSRLDQQRNLLDGGIDTYDSRLRNYDTRPIGGPNGTGSSRSAADVSSRSDAARRQSLMDQREQVDRYINRLQGDALTNDSRR